MALKNKLGITYTIFIQLLVRVSRKCLKSSFGYANYCRFSLYEFIHITVFPHKEEKIAYPSDSQENIL